MDHLRIALDGPAAAGKSTIAKCIAKELGIDYIDTGAMYRAIALKLLRTGIDYNDPEALAVLLDSTDVDFDAGHVYLDEEDVSGLIRTQEVSAVASASSAVQAVRDKLVALQQAMGKRKSLVMDGRDIGTKVFPDAELKFYITASPRVRAERRAKELELAGQPCDVDQIEKEIEERDWRDMHRENSPLVQADDAVLVDTSDRTLEGSVEAVMAYIRDYLDQSILNKLTGEEDGE